MNNILLHFPTCIFLKDNILLNELNIFKENILNYFKINKTNKSFEDSILTNNSFFTKNNIFENNIFDSLKKEIYNNCIYFCKQLGFSDEQIFNYDIQNIWANLIKKHDCHAFHTHATSGSALISGVFYVDAPENATLNFKNLYTNYYTPQFPDCPNDLTFNEYKYNCFPGRMILFKSNTLHGYNCHLNEKDKISIAFNFGIKNK